MNKKVKIIVEIALLLVCAGLVYLIYSSIMQPVRFNRQKDYRESIAVERLKDIRTIQVAYKSVNGKFTSNLDTLIHFYNNGKMEVVMQVGSADDSVAVAKTEALKKKGLKAEDLLKMHLAGEKDLFFSTRSEVAVKDTLAHTLLSPCVDSIAYMPFTGGKKVNMEAVIKTVSGVNVPLFEANIPYDDLLKGLDRQLIVNLKADCRDKNRFEGLQVGSIETPNNNAGNWE